MPQLVAENLVLQRGFTRLFGDLSFSAGNGQILWLQGPNGAGKTSLLRALAGLLPYDGNIIWENADIQSDMAAYMRGISWLGYADGVRGELTVLENVEFLGGAGDVMAALHYFGLENFLEVPARFLSAGQRKRIALAALWMQQQKPLWLLDEPLAHLDESAAKQLSSLLSARQKNGLITVLASHQPLPGLKCDILSLGAQG
ncbi:MAG: heme ABC exporter ATP-binding protein CcmA [Alphaproteobacteria bacterium]|nr:MAG: heme ABC exporter ATP-binding protein CcmA [Alphaproteobacteria bacterium]